MSRKHLSEAQKNLVRAHQKDTPSHPDGLRGILFVFLFTLMLFSIGGGAIGLTIALALAIFGGLDVFNPLLEIGLGSGAVLSAGVTGTTIAQAVNQRHPLLRHIKDPELAEAIDTALAELPVGFEWTFEGDDKDGTLGIALEGDTKPIISVSIIDPDADQPFTVMLKSAAGMLHDFFLATKHLSKDPARVGPQGSHTLRIVRNTQTHPDRDIITGSLQLTTRPSGIHPIEPLTVMHEHSENLPVRMVAATFPAWGRIHQKLTESDAHKKLTREKTKVAVASRFLQQRALEEISRSPQPTDDELLNEL